MAILDILLPVGFSIVCIWLILTKLGMWDKAMEILEDILGKLGDSLRGIKWR